MQVKVYTSILISINTLTKKIACVPSFEGITVHVTVLKIIPVSERFRLLWNFLFAIVSKKSKIFSHS